MAATGTPASRKRAAAAAKLAAAPGVPEVGAGQDQEVAVGRVEIGHERVRQEADAAHRRHGLGRLGDGHDVERRAGEAPRAQLGEQVADLPVGEGVVDGDVCGVIHHDNRLS